MEMPQEPRATNDHATYLNAKPWKRYFLEVLGKALGVAIVGTALVLLSATGILHTGSDGSGPLVRRDGGFIGTVITLCGAFFPFVAVELSRHDKGLPARGITRLVLLSTYIAIAILLLFIICWPFAVDQDSYGTPLAAEYLSTPRAFALTAVYVCVCYFWSSIAFVPLTLEHNAFKIAGILYLVLFMAIGIWRSEAIFSSSTEQGNLGLLLGLAVVGAVLHVVAAILTQRNIQRELAD